MNFKKILTLEYFLPRFRFYAEEAMQSFQISKSWLYFDFIRSFLTTGCTIKDYFLYQFYLRNGRGKKTFATGRWMERYFKKKNDPNEVSLFSNKEETLLHFQQYMNRDWCGQKYHNTEEEYRNFAQKHENGIVKPLEDCGGHGVHIISTKQPGGGIAVRILQAESAVGGRAHFSA